MPKLWKYLIICVILIASVKTGVLALSIKYERKEIAHGIYISFVQDDKFKTNYAAVQFVSSFKSNEASARSIVPNILTVSNSAYPTREELSKKLASLYSASLSESEAIVGDNYVSTIYASCIANDYAMNRETVTPELIDLLITSILSPKLENGAFDENEFSQLKQELLDAIDAEINNKRSYAFSQAKKLIYKNESCCVSSYGTKEDAEKLTNAGVYEIYQSMLESAHIEIMISGGKDIIQASEKLEAAFAVLPRNNVHEPAYYTPSPLKQETEIASDNLDVKQTRLVMAYKCEDKETDIYAAKLFTAMFGITPTSKLFSNVREKMQLCYSCSAIFDEYRSVLIVECGIDDTNLDKTVSAINEQLATIAAGDFTEDELSETKLMLTGAFRSNYDSLFSLLTWYNVQYRRGTAYEPCEVIDMLNAVNREQIIKSARSFKPDVIYSLRPAMQEEGSHEL